MFWITTVALTAFSLSSCVNASTSSLVLDVCKAAGSKKLTVCSVLGFNGADGNAAYETIFSQGFGDQVVVLRDETDIDVGSSDIAVALIKGVELNGDLNGLMVTIQNVIEEAIHRGRPSKLMVIITGVSNRNQFDDVEIGKCSISAGFMLSHLLAIMIPILFYLSLFLVERYVTFSPTLLLSN